MIPAIMIYMIIGIRHRMESHLDLILCLKSMFISIFFLQPIKIRLESPNVTSIWEKCVHINAFACLNIQLRHLVCF